MEQTECSETSAYKIQTPGNYPEENIQHTEHGESLKSKKHKVFRMYSRVLFSSKQASVILNRELIGCWLSLMLNVE
jgi:hypothetical protein